MHRDDRRALLVLDDGTVYPGAWFGAPPALPDEVDGSADRLSGIGEVLFNTAMCGYHEVLTDSSYTGQIVAMTYPHAGNYGDDDEWSESPAEERGVFRPVKAAALVVRRLYRGPVPKGRRTLDRFLADSGVPGITEIDTRALTLHLRDEGNRNGVVVRWPKTLPPPSTETLAAVLHGLRSFPSMEGRNLLGSVGISSDRPAHGSFSESTGGRTDGAHVVIVDCGLKANIVREVEAVGARVTLVPSSVAAEQLLALHPDVVLLSNGPGDPATLTPQVALAKALLGRVPLRGICLGHQILATAMGGRTYKMVFGHHGANHPVRDEYTGRVFVTSQNHGFAASEDGLPAGTDIRFRNANDGSVEGLSNPELNVMTTQFHPEAAPGPHDARWVFGQFVQPRVRAAGIEDSADADVDSAAENRRER